MFNYFRKINYLKQWRSIQNWEKQSLPEDIQFLADFISSKQAEVYYVEKQIHF